MKHALVVLTLAACAEAPPWTAVEVRGEVSQGGARIVSGTVLDPDRAVVVGKGRAVLDAPGEATLRLYSDTTLHLRRRSRGVRLAVGKLWAVVTPRGAASEFAVETHNAVAGVRGTELVVRTDDQDTDIGVVEGEVEVEGAGEKVRLKKGEGSRVKKRGKPDRREYDADADRRLWDRLEAAFHEVKQLIENGVDKVKEVAPEIRDEVKEKAPEVGKKLKKGARDVGKRLKKLFD